MRGLLPHKQVVIKCLQSRGSQPALIVGFAFADELVGIQGGRNVAESINCGAMIGHRLAKGERLIRCVGI